MFRKLLYFAYLCLVLLIFVTVLFGCATLEPKSHIYYPPTQAELDKREADAKFEKHQAPFNNLFLGFRRF